MADSNVSVNRRLGREKELRKKMRLALERFESVFAKPLSVNVIKEFLDHSEKQNRLVFLTDRLGVLSDQDVAYVRTLLKEVTVSPELQPELPTEEIEEITEDMEDFTSGQKLGGAAEFL